MSRNNSSDSLAPPRLLARLRILGESGTVE